MSLPPLTYLNGVTATATLSVGVLMGVTALAKYFRTNREKKLLPVLSVLGFSFGSLYLGGTSTFFHLVATGENLSAVATGTLAYASAPIGIMAALYLGFSVFNPERLKAVMGIYAATTVVYYVAMFGFPEQNIGGEVPYEGAVMDASLESVLLALTLFYIASNLVFLGGGFYKLSKRIEGAERTKALLVFYGVLLFTVGGVIESVASSAIYVVARLLMATSYVLIYRGFA
ncbi:MAG: hypothetical protein Kow0069_15970 [Promethearchaeota archaeon]